MVDLQIAVQAREQCNKADYRRDFLGNIRQL